MTKDLDDLARSDVFDSRDVDKRITELEFGIENRGDEEDALPLKDELKTLTDFRDDVDSREWKYGITFIAGAYFKDHAEQMAEDIGAIDRNAQWPLNHIDWDAAADALKMDYSSVELDGKEFWYRS
jgi:hypothetical protein